MIKPIAYILFLLSSLAFSQNTEVDPFGNEVDGASVDHVKTRVAKESYKIHPTYFNISKATGKELEEIEDKRAFKFFDKPRSVWKVNSGFFAAYDADEFGGALYYFSEAGKERYLISNEHVGDLVLTGENEYISTGGLSHLSMTTGVVMKISLSDGRWHATRLVRLLSGIPKVTEVKDNGNFIIQAHTSLPSGHLTRANTKGAKKVGYVMVTYEVSKEGWMKQLSAFGIPLNVHK